VAAAAAAQPSIEEADAAIKAAVDALVECQRRSGRSREMRV
jgi:hypothetical protein